jgi:hypothetical protein
MPVQFSPISYAKLNARQKENFNLQKVSAVVADYGFVTIRLSDDWQGADFIAQHIDGKTFLRVQLKGRLTFDRKYCDKDLYVAFFTADEWYLYPHDELLKDILENTKIGATQSWLERGGYSFPRLSVQLQQLLAPYRLTGSVKPIPDGSA